MGGKFIKIVNYSRGPEYARGERDAAELLFECEEYWQIFNAMNGRW
ncbi:hypothetical protein DES35_10651 [Schleiferia thermophila]|uniref:Uncharacterized protein n=1 Tax=Schleiferia thermophila TaxID=884107 RepID=A0A368ZY32_9FLAO|nr:hypothetical protein DES35_10651 [Schleiferia thermophila]